jgi:tetratricopeptide (TPR) repeat protein
MLLYLVLAQIALCAAARGQPGPGTGKKSSDAAARLVEQGRYKEAEAALRAAADQVRPLGKQDPRYAATLLQLATVLRYQARYTDAETVLQQVLAAARGTRGDRNLIQAEALNSLAGVYRAQGKFHESAPLYREALAAATDVLGPGHPDLSRFQLPDLPQSSSSPSRPSVAASLDNLADLYRAQGKFDQAEALYKKALEIAEHQGEPGHPEIITCLNNLADLYAAQGKQEEAEQLYERAMQLTVQASAGQPENKAPPEPGAGTPSRRNPDLALTLNSLADFKRAQGKLGESENLYKRALEIDEAALGPNHPALAVTLNNLADLYAAQGRHQDADVLDRRAARIRQMSLASDELDISTYRQALVLDEKALGSWHPDVAVDLNSLADEYRAVGRYQEAEQLYRRALAIAETTLGPHDPALVATINNLADLYRAQGKYSQAEPLYKRALALAEKAAAVSSQSAREAVPPAGTGEPRASEVELATHLNDLADFYRAQRKYAEAEPLYWKAVVLCEKARGRGNPTLAVTLNNLGDLYRAQGRNAEAEPLYRRALLISKQAEAAPESGIQWALAIDETAGIVDYASVARDLVNLADIYAGQGKHAEAEALYKRALTMQEKLRGPASEEVAAGLEKYARLLRTERRTAEAEKLETKATSIRTQKKG